MAAAPIERVIKAALDRGASDIHIKAGDLFRARIDGRLVALTRQRLSPAETRSIALKLLGTDGERARLDELRDFDFSWGLAGVGRFRVSLLKQRSSFMIVMRAIPFAVPTLEQLELPPSVGELAELEDGLVLVAGGGGSGTSSTIAAMLHHLNQTAERHIVTVEDPIEFLHRDLKSSVTQREVGIDTASVVSGLRAAMRHDPDVIVVGEIRDGDTVSAALRAAETGALVIGALRASDAAAAVQRVIAMVNTEDRDLVRTRLADVLRGVVAQRLIARKGRDGRVPVVEVMRATTAVQQCLRDDRLAELPVVAARDAERAGGQTFEQHLARLVESGAITAEAAGISRPERAASRSRR